MSVLTITEFSTFTMTADGIPPMPALAEQSVSLEPISQKSNKFGPNSHFILLACDSDCFLAFGGEEVEAKEGFHLISGGESRVYSVRPGTYVAVIEGTD